MDDKSLFISLATTINREGIGDLLDYLDKYTDFFTAPASSTYHLNEEGGLVRHSLNVYDNMYKLKEAFYPEMEDDTVKLLALFHDIAKIGFYEKSIVNKKVYSPNGSKSDEMGRFDWVATPGYKTKEAKNRDFIWAEHGTNSFILLNKFVKLSDGETAAIINHHMGMDCNYLMKDLNEACNRYPELVLLHQADMLAVYFQENPYKVND